MLLNHCSLSRASKRRLVCLHETAVAFHRRTVNNRPSYRRRDEPGTHANGLTRYVSNIVEAFVVDVYHVVMLLELVMLNVVSMMMK